MKKLSPLEWLVVVVITLAVVLACMLVVHTVWTWVLPYFWPAGPEEIIRPNFWMFTLAWFMLGWIFKLIGLRK